MAFLSGLNGGSNTSTTPTKASGSSRFLGGIRQLDEREHKVQGYKAEEEKAKAEAARLNDPWTIAKETVTGIPGVLRDVGKALVDDPMKTLATPVIRAEQAALTGIGMATGNENLQRAANAPLEFPSMFGGSAGTIEPQRAWEEGGAKQIVGDTAKYAATVYTGGRVAPLAKTGFLGQITKAGLQGAKEGAIGGGLYMGGDELQRPDSTIESTLAETAKGVGFGGGAGFVLGAGGAALARPGVQARTLRPLSVQDGNAPAEGSITLYRGAKNERPGEGAVFEGTYTSPDRTTAERYGDNVFSTNMREEDFFDATVPGPAGRTIGDIQRIAQEQGYRGIKSTAGGKPVYVVFNEHWAPEGVPNIRRIKQVPVQDLNVRPGRTRANARQVPINRVPEPYLSEAEMPVINMGPKPKSGLPEIQFARPSSRAKGDISYEPIQPVKPASADITRTTPQDVPRAPKPTRIATKTAAGAKPLPTAKPAPQVRITPTAGRPVTMDVPKKVATVEVKAPRPGQATTVSKAASDANKKLAEQGYEAIPEEELAKIGSINKADQLDKVARLLDDPRSKDMAAGTAKIPDGVAPQVLFNAVKNRAVKEGDFETLQRLARSRIAEERATAAQTLGSAGYNNEPADALAAMRDVEKARADAATRRRQPSDVKKEAKTAETFIKKARAKQTWDDVINSLTC